MRVVGSCGCDSARDEKSCGRDDLGKRLVLFLATIGSAKGSISDHDVISAV